MTTDTFYFAYGSNLNSDDCRERGFPIELLEPVSSAWLPDYCPIYHYRSRTRNGGALDVIQSLGQVTPGLLFRVHGNGWEALNAKEGAPNYYAQRTVTVLTAAGEMIPAITYCVTPEQQLNSFVEPALEYAQLVNAGLIAWGLPTLAHTQAANNEQPTFTVRHVFAYGLLQAEYDLGRSLTGIAQRQSARIHGQIFDLGSYPGWLPTGSTNEWVHGELLALEQPDLSLSRIDQIEGFNGYTDESLYHRVLVMATTDNDEEVFAWCYRYAKSIDSQPLLTGRWNS